MYTDLYMMQSLSCGSVVKGLKFKESESCVADGTKDPNTFAHN